MGSIAGHRKRIEEHLEELKDAINTGIQLRPATIGFHSMGCAVELLELYLHRKALIDPGKIIKHDWFKRPKQGQKIDPLIERKLPVNFEGKDEIYGLLYNIEENRDGLIYGNSSRQQIELVLEAFQKLKSLLLEMLEKEGESIG